MTLASNLSDALWPIALVCVALIAAVVLVWDRTPGWRRQRQLAAETPERPPVVPQRDLYDHEAEVAEPLYAEDEATTQQLPQHERVPGG